MSADERIPSPDAAWQPDEGAERVAGRSPPGDSAAYARLTALQTVTAALSGAASLDEVLTVALKEATAAVGAAAASVGVLDATGDRIETFTTGFPERITSALRSLTAGAALPGPTVVRDGRARYYADQTALAAEFPSAVVVVAGTPYEAAAVVPLQAGDARLGFLTVHFLHREVLGQADRDLLTALAQQCAVAVERARTADVVRVERDTALRLQALAGRLARAADVGDVAGILADRGAALLGASVSNVSVFDPASRMLTMVGATATLPDAVVEQFARWPVDAPLPSRDVFATGRPVLFTSLADRDRRYPAIADVPVRQQAWATLLLRSADRPLGLVAFGWDDPREFGAEDVDLMQVIADMSAGALERARLTDEHRTIAETLQRGLLPARLPRVRGWRLAARYQPAGTAVRAGGDWYDAFPLPGDQLGLVIGDVAGHGVEAAALMGQARALAHAEARSGDDPGRVLARLDDALHETAESQGRPTLVTCAYLQIDRRNSVLRGASAGQVPPLLRRPARPGEDAPGAAYLPLVPGPPLGLGLHGTYTTHRHVLPGGSTVVLFTDGLVERRDQPLDAGLDRLCHLVEEGSEDVEELIEHVVAAMHDPARIDDVAVLVARSGR